MSRDEFEAAVLAELKEIKETAAKLWARVDHLERRASFWGAVGGALTMIATRLGGCI